jgi:hypothetical protein
VGHPLKYRASPLKYGALTLYLVGLRGSTGSNRELPRLLQGLMRYITKNWIISYESAKVLAFWWLALVAKSGYHCIFSDMPTDFMSLWYLAADNT